MGLDANIGDAKLNCRTNSCLSKTFCIKSQSQHFYNINGLRQFSQLWGGPISFSLTSMDQICIQYSTLH